MSLLIKKFKVTPSVLDPAGMYASAFVVLSTKESSVSDELPYAVVQSMLGKQETK